MDVGQSKTRTRKADKPRQSNVTAGFYAEARCAEYVSTLGLEWLTHSQQLGAVRLIRRAYRVTHEHKWYDGHVSIGYKSWRYALGASKRQQADIKRLKAQCFDQPDTGIHPSYSQRKGVSEAYTLNPATRTAIEAMNKPPKQRTRIIDTGNGQPVRTRTPAIDTRASGGLSLAGIPAYCPVNLPAMVATQNAIQRHLEAHDGKRARPPVELGAELQAVWSKIFHSGKSDRRSNDARYRQYLTRVDNELTELMFLAGGQCSGHVPQRFRASAAGRFYATDINLQNCTKLARNAALAGCYSYDIESCHHAIALHYAERYSLPCGRLRYYVENKAALRLELAMLLGGEQHIPVIKTALIAMIYGAEAGHFGKLRETLGSHGYALMFGHRRFAGLFDELQAVFRAVIDGAELDPKTKSVVNALGRVDIEATNDRQRVAHMFQAIESQALQAAFKVHESAIVPLHDGWICHAHESVESAQAAIQTTTGINLEIGEPEQLKLSGIKW